MLIAGVALTPVLASEVVLVLVVQPSWKAAPGAQQMASLWNTAQPGKGGGGAGQVCIQAV